MERGVWGWFGNGGKFVYKLTKKWPDLEKKWLRSELTKILTEKGIYNEIDIWTEEEGQTS